MPSARKIVVINDLHPEDAPGAASVAWSFANEASKDFEVEYWSSSGASEKKRVGAFPEYFFQTKDRKPGLLKSVTLSGAYAEFLNIKAVYWIFKRIYLSKPDSIWIHQVGNVFPKSTCLIARLFRIPTIITLHDYTCIIPRKLFPSDFTISEKELNSLIRTNELSSIELRRSFRPSLGSNKLFVMLRQRLLKNIYKSASAVVALSDIQEKIYSDFGFKVTRVIRNGVSSCHCNLDGVFRENKVLFAGRPNAKGLNICVDFIQRNPEYKLVLAGPTGLLDYAKSHLEDKQYEYLGSLSQNELFSVIHSVKYVSVLSQCFDVYPSITLEALNHGADVITTYLTGNHNLISSNGRGLVIDSAMKLSKIQAFVGIQNPIRLHDYSEAWNEYKPLFKSFELIKFVRKN